jgi:pimeloyl-ACP methyl ester carboxylesterase
MKILLIHGAWHGAWCYKPLIAALQARGREAIAIDLPGAGDDPADPAGVTFLDCAARVVQTARGLGGPVLLVGHSMGGMVITLAAELAPECFAALAYIAAIVPGHGESALMLTATDGTASPAKEALSADGRLLNVAPAEQARAAFYHDCPEEYVADALPRLRPVPTGFLLTPVQLPKDRAAALPRHYIECTEDRILPITLQRRMVAARGGMVVHRLACAHSPFYAMPGALADILAAVK